MSSTYTPPPSRAHSFAEAYSNLASAYKDAGQLDDSITCYRKALALSPDSPEAFAKHADLVKPDPEDTFDQYYEGR